MSAPARKVETGERTRYELVAQRGEERVLLMYTARNNRVGLYRALQERADHLERVFGSLKITWGKRATDGLILGKDWHVHFSGRTQRDCYTSELPFVCDIEETL